MGNMAIQIRAVPRRDVINSTYSAANIAVFPSQGTPT
jgi:hypothetical protein